MVSYTCRDIGGGISMAGGPMDRELQNHRSDIGVALGLSLDTERKIDLLTSELHLRNTINYVRPYVN